MCSHTFSVMFPPLGAHTGATGSSAAVVGPTVHGRIVNGPQYLPGEFELIPHFLPPAAPPFDRQYLCITSFTNNNVPGYCFAAPCDIPSELYRFRFRTTPLGLNTVFFDTYCQTVELVASRRATPFIPFSPRPLSLCNVRSTALIYWLPS